MLFELKDLTVNGKTILSGLICFAPQGVTVEEATERIQTWGGNIVGRRTNEDAQTFLREERNNVFPNGIEVKTHAVEVKEA